MDIYTFVILAALIILGCILFITFARKKKEEEKILPSTDVKPAEVSMFIPANDNEGKEQLTDQLKAQLETLKQQESLLQTQLKNKNEEYEELKERIKTQTSQTECSDHLKELKALQEQLFKIKQELEEKEEDIEDLEDQCSSLKKKLKKRQDEFDETYETLQQTTQALKHTESELKSAEYERDNILKEDNLKAEAIDFINAIVNAKDANDKDTSDKDAIKVSDQVRKIEDIVLDQYISLLNTYFKNDENVKECKENARLIITKWGNLQRKSWLKKKKVIAFIGEFSAGKTSIVNRILSQDDPNTPMLPVSGKATTAIATYISYNVRFSSHFTDANGNLKKIDKEMFEKVNKDILSRVNVSSLIQYFVMGYNNENLKGLSILDTPGFSSSDEEDKDRTLEVVHEADALFWVMDANTGDINRSSLKIISENLGEIPLYIIINKSDTKSPGELNKLEEHVRQTMENSHIQVRDYIRFSQEADIEELMRIVKSLPETRTGMSILNICQSLVYKIDELQQGIKSLKHEIRQEELELNRKEEDIFEVITNQQYAAERIAEIPQANSHWFRDDDYRMDENEFEEMKSLCENVSEFSEDLKYQVQSLKDEQELYLSEKGDYSDLKEVRNATENVYNQLKNAIRSFDESLYQDLMKEVNNKTNQKERKITN